MSQTEAFRAITSTRRLRSLSRPRGQASVAVRSLLFRLLLYGYAGVGLATMLPLLLFARAESLLRMAQRWARFGLWLLRHLCGVKVVLTGMENVPQGACLVASQHQSAIETLVLLANLPLPGIVIKKQLFWIPCLRFYAGKTGLIHIERTHGPLALHSIIIRARAVAVMGRPILIFPEGSRARPGARFHPKVGIVALYESLGIPCVPVRVETGHLWAAGGFCIYPGTVQVTVQPAIGSGLKRAEFMQRLVESIEH